MSSEQPAEINFLTLYQDVNKNIRALEQAIIELNNSIENITVIFENTRLVSAFTFIHRLTQSSSYRQTENNSEIFLRHKFHDYLSKLLQNIASTCDQLDPHSNRTTVDGRKVDLLCSSQYIINFIVSNSTTFRIEFFKAGGTAELFVFLKNNKFVEKFHTQYFFSTILGNINWLSRHADSFKNEWRMLDVIDLLLNIASKYSDCKMPAYSAFANIANDNEISTLPDMHVIVPQYIKCVSDAVTEMKKPNVTLKRERINFIEDENDDRPQLFEVYFVRIDLTTTHSLTGILLTLYRLSINNKIKYDLYVKYNLKDYLPVIIYKGSDIERKYALQLLAQLCFDPQVNDIVNQNNELKNFIKNLIVNKATVPIKSIIKICEQIMWTIETNHKSVVASTNQNKTEMSKQIMISYNAASRSLCIRIKEELEKAGFRIWIDINEIHGSSLESMARAIETSDYILMCITEKYRQSINCQAEAQYAFKLQKRIIPIIMQEGYERVDGWLGMIMGDKIYINFVKYNFEDSLKRLLHELSVSSAASTNTTQTAAADTVVDKETANNDEITKVSVKLLYSKPVVNERAMNKDSIKKWSEEQVTNWFKDKNVHQGIIKEIKPCDGDLLYQMHMLQVEAPEFFYQAITKDKSVDLRSALLFSKNLKELFAN